MKPTAPACLLCSLRFIVTAALIGLLGGSLGVAEEALPLVIPQPQALHRLSKQFIPLGEAGAAVARTVVKEKEPLLDESAQLLALTLRNTGLSLDSRPPKTVILLATRPGAEAGSAAADALRLTDRESATLARSEQAYIIRTQPGVPARVWVVGSSSLGTYYGVATLVQLVSRANDGGVVLPHFAAQDYPDVPNRMCADWVLAWDWEVNGYDWGDGVRAFIDRCKRKIDLCARYKVNRIRFLGGRIAPGPAYMQDRWWRICNFAPELNRYASRKGVRLQYASTSFGIDHYSWGLPYPEPWILNRESYPDGKVYSCVGGTAGSCLSNDALIERIIQRQEQLVRELEPTSLYLHNIDTAMYKDLAVNWKSRCPRCRERFPEDEPNSPRGYAGAVAALYNRITTALRGVTNRVTGYDAARDLELVFASPGYSYWTEDDAEWAKDIQYFSQIGRQVVDKRQVQLTFREQFQRLDGRGLRTAEMARALEGVGWTNAMFMFAVQGADFLDSANLLVSSPVLTATYGGAGTLYNFNGHAFCEVQVLANVNYAWNHRAAGWVDPARFPGRALRAEAARYSAGKQHSDALYGQFLEVACARVYGEKAAPAMAAVFRLERAKGAIMPLAAGIDQQWKNAAYDWKAQAERNLEAKQLVRQAAAACDMDASTELARLVDDLDVCARICMLCHARYQEKLEQPQLSARATSLLTWLDANFNFNIAEPDGGDKGLWKNLVRRIGNLPPPP